VLIAIHSKQTEFKVLILNKEDFLELCWENSSCLKRGKFSYPLKEISFDTEQVVIQNVN